MISIYSENGNAKEYNRIAKALFKHLKLKGRGAVELIFADELMIKKVNRDFRQIDAVTDVLSFPTVNSITVLDKRRYPSDYDPNLKAVFLGSIMICLNRATEQAIAYGHSLEREMSYLFLHGLLHLLGFDHENEQEKRLMRDAEESVLGMVGIK